jgi:hypothetical protein
MMDVKTAGLLCAYMPKERVAKLALTVSFAVFAALMLTQPLWGYWK